MKAVKSPGAVAALGASVVDQLGRQVIPEINRQQQLPQAAIRTAGVGDRAMMAASNGGAQRRPAFVAGAQAGPRTPEQRSADLIAAQELHRIAKFAAARRRQWPGAMIALRPDSMIATEVVNSGPPRGEPRKDGSVRRTKLAN